MTHICVSKLSIIGSDNGLSPDRRQATIWTNAGILVIGTLGTNFNEILIKIQTFSFKNINLKMSSGKWRPFCLGLNVLREILYTSTICDTWHIKAWTIWPIILKFCTEHSIDTAVLCTKFQNNWTAESDVMEEWDLARFEFKMSFRQISYIAQHPLGSDSLSHRCFIVRSCKASKLRDLSLELSDFSQFWRASWQHC